MLASDEPNRRTAPLAAVEDGLDARVSHHGAIVTAAWHVCCTQLTTARVQGTMRPPPAIAQRRAWGLMLGGCGVASNATNVFPGASPMRISAPQRQAITSRIQPSEKEPAG